MNFNLSENYGEIINEIKKSIQQPDWVINNPKVTIIGDKIRLFHYGDDGGRGYLDPEFFGVHSHTSDVDQWRQPRLCFMRLQRIKK